MASYGLPPFPWCLTICCTCWLHVVFRFWIWHPWGRWLMHTFSTQDTTTCVLVAHIRPLLYQPRSGTYQSSAPDPGSKEKGSDLLSWVPPVQPGLLQLLLAATSHLWYMKKNFLPRCCCETIFLWRYTCHSVSFLNPILLDSACHIDSWRLSAESWAIDNYCWFVMEVVKSIHRINPVVSVCSLLG